MARKALTKKVRFEVFKRDLFTCQYCGVTAPNAVLQVDHINPVASGGTNEILNLITSCFECNSGKSDRLLSDDAVITKQVVAAKVLAEKREQLQMMADWAQSLRDLNTVEIGLFCDYLERNFNIALSDHGVAEFRKTIKKFGLPDVLEAADKSANQYLKESDNSAHQDKFLDYIPKICYWQKRERENPVESELRKIAYTANRLWYRCNPHTLSLRLIEIEKMTPLTPADLMRLVSKSTGIMAFEEGLQALLGGDDNG